MLPDEVPAWRLLEETARRLALLRGYREIRPALLEEVELFTRAVGEVTDIVQKEMFTMERRGATDLLVAVAGPSQPPVAREVREQYAVFLNHAQLTPSAEDAYLKAAEMRLPGGSFTLDADKGSEEKSRLALRPEGTAGIVRAYLEAGYAGAAPLQRLFHVGPMFRYERPQKGRERMFTQFDVEVLGSLDARLDAEVINLAACFFEALGITGLQVRVNSMGDGDDRDRWREAVRAFLAPTIAQHCDLCRQRFERNVLRVLDCKNPRCKELNAGAPTILGFLTPENQKHFQDVRALLLGLGRTVVVDPGIVRGLDYYTRSVFEIHAPALGARSALCGGGRYDHLVAELGGPDLGAVGFAVGFTGTMIVLRELGLLDQVADESARVFVVAADRGLENEVFKLSEELREGGVSAVYDVEKRSLKAQMKLANKGGHRYALVLGGAERARGTVQLKDLATGEQHELSRGELLARLGARDAGP